MYLSIFLANIKEDRKTKSRPGWATFEELILFYWYNGNVLTVVGKAPLY